MADPSFYIYVLFRETGVPFYVGKGKYDRWLHHQQETKRYNTHKHAIIRKMRAAGHEIPMVKLHEGLTEDIAFAYEKALIAAIGRHDKKLGLLANQTDGGEGVSGWRASPETRALMSAKRLGRKLPPISAEHRAKIVAVQRNRSPEHAAKLLAAARNRAPEWRMKISVSNKGRKNAPEAYARGAAKRTGMKRSAETRAKQSASMIGLKRGPMSAEHRAKISAVWKGKKRAPFSTEHRAKISASRRNSAGKTRIEDARQHSIPHLGVVTKDVSGDT